TISREDAEGCGGAGGWAKATAAASISPANAAAGVAASRTARAIRRGPWKRSFACMGWPRGRKTSVSLKGGWRDSRRAVACQVGVCRRQRARKGKRHAFARQDRDRSELSVLSRRSLPHARVQRLIHDKALLDGALAQHGFEDESRLLQDAPRRGVVGERQ